MCVENLYLEEGGPDGSNQECQRGKGFREILKVHETLRTLCLPTEEEGLRSGVSGRSGLCRDHIPGITICFPLREHKRLKKSGCVGV